MAKGRKTGGGSRLGSRNKRGAGIDAFAKSILDDPAYQKNLRRRAIDGVLAPAVETMLYYYAYGKPKDLDGSSGPVPREIVITF